jgi:hypothetical protein
MSGCHISVLYTSSSDMTLTRVALPRTPGAVLSVRCRKQVQPTGHGILTPPLARLAENSVSPGGPLATTGIERHSSTCGN